MERLWKSKVKANVVQRVADAESLTWDEHIFGGKLGKGFIVHRCPFIRFYKLGLVVYSRRHGCGATNH